MNIDSNPMKILYYTDRLLQIKDNIIPYPVMLEIDPCNFCNFECWWCSSRYGLEHKEKSIRIIPERFKYILDFIKFTSVKKGLYGIYWCGGGEATLNPHLLDFMQQTKDLGLRNYITTNGSILNSLDLEKLLELNEWIGVSVAACDKVEWVKSGGTKIDFNLYKDGLSKINQFNERRKVSKEVNFKFVYDNKTYVDIVDAYVFAKSLGFKKITIKPVDLFIYDRGKTKFGDIWDRVIINSINDAIGYVKSLAKLDKIELDCADFYGMFDVDKDRKTYHKCWTAMLAPVFGADGLIHVCCVRRGERSVGRWDDGKLIEYWGSKDHMDKLFCFDPSNECPMRCKFHRYNEIFQQIFKDGKFSLGAI